MSFLPIVDRELRVAARRRGTYWSRAGAGLVAIILGSMVYAAFFNSTPREFGTALFFMLSGVILGYCLLAGLFLTADSLSEEKREGTLGLLFLTDLKGYDVVFGKLAATSLNGFYRVFAVIPVLAIPLLIGGTSAAQFWRMTLVLVVTFLYSQAVGIFISSLSLRPRKAMAGTFLLLLLFSAGFPVVAMTAHFALDLPDKISLPLLSPCPIFPFALAEDSSYAGQRGYFWLSIGVIHGLTWLLLALATWTTPRSWQDKPAGKYLARWRNLLGAINYGRVPARKSLRKRLLDVNAFYWLAGRSWFNPINVWGWIGAAVAFWYWAAKWAGAEWFNDLTYLLTAFVLNALLKIWLASEAGRRLAEDRKIGALELVLSTPQTIGDILRGQWLALARQFLGPVLFVIGLEIIFLIASLKTAPAHGNRAFLLTIWGGFIFMLLADLIALGWVGMWTALTAKSPNRVTGLTITRVLIEPWAAWILIIIGLSILDEFLRQSGTPSFFDPTWKFFVGLWIGLGVLIDVAFGVAAWWQLRTRFRQLAMQRFSPIPSRLARLLARVGWKRPAEGPGVTLL